MPKWSDRFTLEYLIRAVQDAAGFATLPKDRLTTTAAEMVATLDGERARFLRVQRWNKRQADAAAPK
jgi:hypothetical protein